MTELRFELPDAVLEAVAERAADLALLDPQVAREIGIVTTRLLLATSAR